jgi:hypothetical protein
MKLFLNCVFKAGLIAMIAMLTGCGGAGSELDTPASTGSSGGTSVAAAAAAAAAAPLNIAVKPVANPSTVSTSATGTSIGVPTVNGK